MRIRWSPRATIPFFVTFFLFTLTITRTEFPGDNAGAGKATLLRIICALALMVVLPHFYRAGISVRGALTAALVAGYMLILNAIQPSLFGLMTPVGIFAGVMIGFSAVRTRHQLMVTVIRAYMMLNVIGLALGGLVYLVTGALIDLHELLFPWSAARVDIFLGFPRLTSFQVEPGTYANTMFLLALISGALRRKLWGSIEAIAVVSTLFTLSAWAALGAGFYLLGVLLQLFAASSGRKLSVSLRIAIPALVVVPALVLFALQYSDGSYVQYLMARFDTEDGAGSISYKLQAWDVWKSHLWFPMVFGHSLNNEFCGFCASPQDLGTGLNLLYYFGAAVTLPLAVVVALGLVKAAGWPYLFSMAPLITAKFYFYDPVVWVLVGIGVAMWVLRPHEDTRVPRQVEANDCKGTSIVSLRRGEM